MNNINSEDDLTKSQSQICEDDFLQQTTSLQIFHDPESEARHVSMIDDSTQIWRDDVKMNIFPVIGALCS